MITPPFNFSYLKDRRDLINHLNGIHLWHKLPDIVIVAGFDRYIELYSDTYNSCRGAHLATSLVDALSVCAKKNQNNSFLILAATLPPQECTRRFQIFLDIYFPNFIWHHDHGEKNRVLKQINNLYSHTI